MRVTAVEHCKTYLKQYAISTSVFAWSIHTKYYIWNNNGLIPTFSSKTIRQAVKELDLVCVNGYKAARNMPVGSFIYVFQENLKACAKERTDNKA